MILFQQNETQIENAYCINGPNFPTTYYASSRRCCYHTHLIYHCYFFFCRSILTKKCMVIDFKLSRIASEQKVNKFYKLYLGM